MQFTRCVVVLLFMLSITSIISAATLASSQHAAESNEIYEQKFHQFVATIRQEAQQRGISSKTITKYLTGFTAPRVQALHKLHNQPQAVLTFTHYLNAFIPPKRVAEGRRSLQKYHTLLLQIQQRYHVQPRFIVALWGSESNFGHIMGRDPMVASLITLAYQHHRSDFYRKQVFAALTILDHQVLLQQALSTWDGGMGQPSFEPSVYLRYAVDFDHNGFANIWTSMPDIFASIGNFLQHNGWNGKQTWGMEVTIPPDLPADMVGRHHHFTIAQWRAQGVRPLHGGRLPAINSTASLLLPGGRNGRAILVFHNFSVLLRWNNTTFEGIAVGLLSDQIKLPTTCLPRDLSSTSATQGETIQYRKTNSRK